MTKDNFSIHEIIRNRRSVRQYSSKPIPTEVLKRLKDALRFAPSACNFQPWKFIFVTDNNLKTELSRLANNQTFIAGASLIVVGCGYPNKAYKKMGGYKNSVDIDIAIALDYLTLAAVSEGLGTCWIGAFQEEQVKDLLNVPEQVVITAMMLVGYPSSSKLIHPISENQRKPESEIFCTNYYK